MSKLKAIVVMVDFHTKDGVKISTIRFEERGRTETEVLGVIKRMISDLREANHWVKEEWHIKRNDFEPRQEPLKVFHSTN